jgi:glutathione S-transferase
VPNYTDGFKAFLQRSMGCIRTFAPSVAWFKHVGKTRICADEGTVFADHGLTNRSVTTIFKGQTGDDSMLKIYGVYQSRASRNYWMALELGIEFESIPVVQSHRLADPLAADAPLNTQSPEFIKLNANGHIPTIDDDGLVLGESIAINLYLASKHRGPLAAGSLAEEGLINQWSLWGVSEVEPHSVQIVRTYDRNLQGTPGGQETIAVATRLLKKPLGVLEAHLAGQDYLVGERFTVADLNLVEIIRYVLSEKDLFAGLPNISAWVERCHDRDAFRTMMASRKAEG